jgi:spermidine synthase
MAKNQSSPSFFTPSAFRLQSSVFRLECFGLSLTTSFADPLVPEPGPEPAVNPSGVLLVTAAAGMATLTTQLLSIREFLTQLQGNEFVIALVLFNWLVWGGLGMLAARGFSRRFTPTAGRLIQLCLGLAALAPVHLMAIRLLPRLLFIPGASVGFEASLAFSFGVSGPYGFAVGLALPYGLFVLRRDHPTFPGTLIYLADNAGDVAGGALFAFVLVYLTTPFQALAIAHVALIPAVWLLGKATRDRGGMWPMAAVACLLLGMGLAAEDASLRPVAGELVFWRESPYGRLCVVKDNGQVTVFEDGVPATFSQDAAGAEEAVHYALVQPERVGRVLMISAEAGMMAEAAKHRPEAVDWVEINPQTASLRQRFGLIEAIPGLNLILKDGRRFLAETDRRYDAIIVSLPEPATFQVNRFFTDRFFALARRHLTDQGVLSFAVRGYDNVISATQRQKIALLRATAGLHFNHIGLIPGNRLYFICGRHPIHTDIPARLADRGIATQYLADYFDGNVTAERLAHVNAGGDAQGAPNRDFQPRLLRIVWAEWFAIFGSSPAFFLAALAVAALVYLKRLARPDFVLFSTGFALMGSETLVIFAFQVFFGHIYLQIGLIVTIFLAGLFPGALAARRLKTNVRQRLLVGDLALILLTAAFAAALVVMADGLPAGVYWGFGFAAALVCGYQFPLVLELGGQKDSATTRAFAADLMGAAAGTLVTSVVLVPYTGLIGAAAGLIGIKGLSIVVMAGKK